MKALFLSALIAAAYLCLPHPAVAADGKLLGLLGGGSATSLPASDVTLHYQGRDIYVHAPKTLPASGSRALVVVLHGGMGNGLRIAGKSSEKGMNLDALADQYGFIVAYMNGTPVTKIFGADKKGWNAGLCCGQSAANNIDDVGYISGAVAFLGKQYGVDAAKVYGVGHSNGAMMTQRVMCEAGIYAAGVSISGTLELKQDNCPAAKGRRILSILGAEDTSVPLNGGNGTGIDSRDYKNSQAYSKKVFENSGAVYTLDVVKGAQHKLDTIDAALQKTEGTSLPEKITAFFGLNH